MDAARIIGVSMAGSAILSGLVIGGAELYRKTLERSAPKQGEGDDEKR